MNLKKLDLEEFYQEANAYYQQMGTNAPFGLGGVILITPIQTIGVYNQEAMDIEGNMVPGLGGHGQTVNSILANIFNLQLEGNDYKKNKILNKAVKGTHLNYVYIILTNSLAGKMAVIEIPYKISEKELAELSRINNILINLGVETMALISNFDPTQKDGGKKFDEGNTNELTDVTLSEALNYLSSQNIDRVPPTMNRCNVHSEEHFYTYQEAKDILKRN